MSFLRPRGMTKKRFKFHVTLFIDELTSVTSVTGFLYCKLRLLNGLLNGGTFADNTEREMVKDHSVTWRHKFEFNCKLSADPNSGILEPCVVRLSIRKEVRGGRNVAKVGLVDLNLAEFAGSGQTSRHCLLEAYNEKNRLDNSILKIVVGMQLLSGDPCYKVPTVYDMPLQLPTEHSTDAVDGSMLDSDSSGFGSLPRHTPKHARGQKNKDCDGFEPGHTRNSSVISQRSDYSSHHSRTPSSISQGSCSMDCINECDAAAARAAGGGLKSPHKSGGSRMPPPRPPPPHVVTACVSENNRMDDTRVDNEDVVSKLIENQDFTQSKNCGDGDNLQLYISSDGSTALGGQHLHNRAGSGVFHPVVFGHDSHQRGGASSSGCS